MATVIKTTGGDYDLTNFVTVLTHTPSPTRWTRCLLHLELGDGAKNLTGGGGSYQVSAQIGSQQRYPIEAVTFGTGVRAAVNVPWDLLVPPGAAVTIQVKSPNAGDSDVHVDAYLLAEPQHDAAVWLTRDDTAATPVDRYQVWFTFGGQRIAPADVATPKLTVVTAAAAVLINGEDLGHAGEGIYTYAAEGVERLTLGTSYRAIVSATIDTQVQTVEVPLSLHAP